MVSQREEIRLKINFILISNQYDMVFHHDPVSVGFISEKSPQAHRIKGRTNSTALAAYALQTQKGYKKLGRKIDKHLSSFPP